MEFKVSEEAGRKLIEEMRLEKGDRIKIFTKIYGGIPTVFPSYYLGIMLDNDETAGVEVTIDGVSFYLMPSDTWLIDDYDLHVVLVDDEVEYRFTQPGETDAVSGASKKKEEAGKKVPRLKDR